LSRRSNSARRTAVQPAGVPGSRIGTAALHAALEEALVRHSGQRRIVVRLERQPSIYSTSFAMEELDVRLDDGTSFQLLYKDLSRHALLEDARQAKPTFLYDPLREIETYRSILGPNRLGTPICYGAIVEPRAERYGLLLEKVRGVELYQVGDLATWWRVAEWLAVVHARFAEETRRLVRAAPLLRYDGDYYRLWADRARASLGRAGLRLSSDARRGMEQLFGNYDQVVERLVALPVTFLHGEFYASNVLVHEERQGLRVCPVDWEMAAVGPGLIDLAALTAGGWTADEREALTLAYRAALVPCENWPPAPDAFLASLDYCRLHLAVQWLGWSQDWTPPPEHAQDWLGEALGLAEKLGVV
jgi:Phosphotransferase enzyme family